MEKVPQSANRNEAPGKRETLITEMEQYNISDASRADRDRFRELHIQLDKLMMDPQLTPADYQKRNLPWDPRFEKMKQAKLAHETTERTAVVEKSTMPEIPPDWYKEILGYDPQKGDGSRVDEEYPAANSKSAPGAQQQAA